MSKSTIIKIYLNGSLKKLHDKTRSDGISFAQRLGEILDFYNEMIHRQKNPIMANFSKPELAFLRSIYLNEKASVPSIIDRSLALIAQQAVDFKYVELPRNFDLKTLREKLENLPFSDQVVLSEVLADSYPHCFR